MHTLAYLNEVDAWINKINMLKTHQITFFISNMPSSVLSFLNLSRAKWFCEQIS